MSFWPLISEAVDAVVTLGTNDLLSIGGHGLRVVATSVAWAQGPNGAIFVPFRIARSLTAQTMYTLNGTVVAGNIDLGIYTADGTKLVSTGSTPQAGVSVVQSIAITPTQFGPGLFYMALGASSGVSRFLSQNTGLGLKALGLARMAVAFPLPATAVLTSIVSTQVPLFGLSMRTFV